MHKKPNFKAWYHTLPGVVAAIGWYFLFRTIYYWAITDTVKAWWLTLAMLVVTAGAGMLCWSMTAVLPARGPKKKDARPKVCGSVFRDGDGNIPH